MDEGSLPVVGKNESSIIPWSKEEKIEKSRNAGDINCFLDSDSHEVNFNLTPSITSADRSKFTIPEFVYLYKSEIQELPSHLFLP